MIPTKQNANIFVQHLAEVLTPFASNNSNFESKMKEYFNIPGSVSSGLITPPEVWTKIRVINPYKIPGYNLIKILKEQIGRASCRERV